jgi:hypothetical protein
MPCCVICFCRYTCVCVCVCVCVRPSPHVPAFVPLRCLLRSLILMVMMSKPSVITATCLSPLLRPTSSKTCHLISDPAYLCPLNGFNSFSLRFSSPSFSSQHVYFFHSLRPTLTTLLVLAIISIIKLHTRILTLNLNAYPLANITLLIYCPQHSPFSTVMLLSQPIDIQNTISVV